MWPGEKSPYSTFPDTDSARPPSNTRILFLHVLNSARLLLCFLLLPFYVLFMRLFRLDGWRWEQNTVEYANGISVWGYDGSLDSISWYGSHPPQLPCPAIVIHYPGFDLDNSQFSASWIMQKLGGIVFNEYNDQYQVKLESGGARIVTGYAKNTLVSLEVRVLVGAQIDVTIDGKEITLPASREELFSAFGQPMGASSTYYEIGRCQPVGHEPHV
jgi:hypothetical protein